MAPDAEPRRIRRRAVALALVVALASGGDTAATRSDRRHASCARVEVEGSGTVHLVVRSGPGGSTSRAFDVDAAGAWVDLTSQSGARAYAATNDAVVWPRSAALR